MFIRLTRCYDPRATRGGREIESGLDIVSCDPLPALRRDLVDMGLVPAASMWTPLEGGRSNKLWRVESHAGNLVVKLYADGAATPLFANDARAEAIVLEHLKGTGLAPTPIYHADFPVGSVLIYTHQEGVNWRAGPEQAAKVLKGLHSFPVLPPIVELPTAPDGSLALLEQTDAILGLIPAHLVTEVRRLRPEGDVPPSGVCCILHGDPVPDNFVCSTCDNDRAPVLIDWQCPALGDPVLDLALFLSPAMQQVTRGFVLSDDELRAFLDAYADPAAAARLRALRPFLHWRMAAYCLWKITRDKPDLAYVPALDAELAALKHAHS